ncbi:MAG: HDOD domain-containing protein [Dehalococcoidia bacterium]|nr:HDOD domain-containing protein [Dehalococcoidia bacterium]
MCCNHRSEHATGGYPSMSDGALDLKTRTAERIEAQFAQVSGDALMGDLAQAALAITESRSEERCGGYRTVAIQRDSSPAAVPPPDAAAVRAAIGPLLNDPRRLPPAPQIYIRLVKLTENPDVSLGQVADVIMSDTASVAKLLRLVNSPAYGLRGRVPTVAAAVRILGLEALKSVVLASSTDGIFGGPIQGDTRMVEQLWYHSIASAVVAKVIAREVGWRDSEQFLVAGLLHDFGQLVVLRGCPEAFHMVDAVANRQGRFLDAESKIYGTSHASIGGLLAERWGLPPVLLSAINGHHHPDPSKPYPETVAVTNLADVISRALGIGYDGGFVMEPIPASVRSLLGLDGNRIRAIAHAVDEEYPEMEALAVGW